MVSLYREKDDPARKRCGRCRKRKRFEFFHRRSAHGDGFQSYCKSCQRVDKNLRHETPKYQAKRDEYQRRPEVRARALKWQAAYYRTHKDEARARRRTPRGKLRNQLHNWRWKAGRATDPDRRARCLANVAACERELARLEARDRKEAS